VVGEIYLFVVTNSVSELFSFGKLIPFIAHAFLSKIPFGKVSAAGPLLHLLATVISFRCAISMI
jgi:hypothetical protein